MNLIDSGAARIIGEMLNWSKWFKQEQAFQLAEGLKSSEFRHNNRKSAQDKRSLISIGVIDDEQFQPRVNLENLGYKITVIGDPNSIDAVKPHEIILCDLQGVGKSLDNKRQGAFIIREIRRNYPQKFVIAYTGGTQSAALTREAIAAADEFVKKDADIETWTQKLDTTIDQLVDPYKVWLRQRSNLIAMETDTLTILKIEDAYVKSVRSKSSGANTPLSRTLQDTNLSGDVRAVIQGLISSAVFKLLVE